MLFLLPDCQTSWEFGAKSDTRGHSPYSGAKIPKLKSTKNKDNKELSDWPSWDSAAIADASVAYSGAKVDRYRK